MWIKVVLGIVVLALGLWLGLPGRYTQTPDEIDQIMARGGGRRRRVQRRFTPLDWLRKDERGSVRRREHRPFRTAAPERDDPE